jgi:dephospho-CoA kinase
VVDADQLARQVVMPGSAAFDTIVDRFPEAQQPDGQLDRARLRQQILPNPALKQWLEDVTHPLIRQRILSELAAQAKHPYQILDAALLLETRLDQSCDLVVVVDALPEQQRSRVAARDATAPAVIDRIMKQQCSRTERLQKADWVLDNTGTQADLFKAVDQLHQHLMQRSYE